MTRTKSASINVKKKLKAHRTGLMYMGVLISQKLDISSALNAHISLQRKGNSERIVRALFALNRKKKALS
ncbi:MAG TPA: hypothetical protein VE572_03515 [Nitrososphaeraceae archaeon]|nr:hypothetical protein [Nitrososphaeraceae archaeon]